MILPSLSTRIVEQYLKNGHNHLLSSPYVPTILVGRHEGKRPLGRPRRRWEDNIRMDPRELRWQGVEWIHLAQDWGD
jgi:hypothetical protein